MARLSRWAALFSLFFVVSCESSCKTLRPTALPQEAGTDFVIAAYDVLEKEYFDPSQLSHVKLFNAALDGLAEHLKAKQIEFHPQKLSGNRSRTAAKEHFVKEFERAQRFVPNPSPSSFKKHGLAFAATAALLTAVGDSHTAFLHPEVYEEYQRQRTGRTYGGIGIHVRKLEDDFFYVGKVYPDGPAARAGMQRFDRIVAVNGQHITSLRQLVDLVRGPKDTAVSLILERRGQRLHIVTQRGDVESPFLVGDAIQENIEGFELQIGYLLINDFYFDANNGQLNAAFRKVTDIAIAGSIIIDLRGNAGGSIDVLLATLRFFLQYGASAFILKASGGETVHTIRSFPLILNHTVVLIDEDSASAAEIFTAALQENQCATVVGVKSSGNVSAGTVVPLPYGAAMMVTIAQVLTGKRKVLEKVGVTPDVVVPLTKDDIVQGRDAQLAKAIDIVKERAMRYRPRRP